MSWDGAGSLLLEISHDQTSSTSLRCWTCRETYLHSFEGYTETDSLDSFIGERYDFLEYSYCVDGKARPVLKVGNKDLYMKYGYHSTANAWWHISRSGVTNICDGLYQYSYAYVVSDAQYIEDLPTAGWEIWSSAAKVWASTTKANFGYLYWFKFYTGCRKSEMSTTSPCPSFQLVNTASSAVRAQQLVFSSAYVGRYPFTGEYQTLHTEPGYVADLELSFCVPGFYGQECDVFCTRTATCSNQGNCSASAACECDDGYAGDTCSDFVQYCTGVTVLTGEDYPWSGIITDGSAASSKYGHNSDCLWNVILPGSKAVSLTITRLSTEENYDIVSAGSRSFGEGEGDNSFSRHLEVSGELPASPSTLISFDGDVSNSLQPGLSIRFTSDG